MFDVVERHFCDPIHDVEHSRDDLVQEIRLFTDDFFRDNVCERQDALQTSQKTRRYLVDLVSFFQELSGSRINLC